MEFNELYQEYAGELAGLQRQGRNVAEDIEDCKRKLQSLKDASEELMLCMDPTEEALLVQGECFLIAPSEEEIQKFIDTEQAEYSAKLAKLEEIDKRITEKRLEIIDEIKSKNKNQNIVFI